MPVSNFVSIRKLAKTIGFQPHEISKRIFYAGMARQIDGQTGKPFWELTESAWEWGSTDKNPGSFDKLTKTCNQMLWKPELLDFLFEKVAVRNGFMDGWRMAVGEWFSDALDLKQGRESFVLGKCLSFQTGDTIWDHPFGHAPIIWCESLKYITFGLQVMQSRPAGEIGTNRAEYDHGKVAAEVYRINNARTGVNPAGFINCTQTEFVSVLQTGSCARFFRSSE